MKYWVSVLAGEEDLERVFKDCSGKSVFLVSNFPSREILEKVLDGILRSKPKDLTVYFLGEEISREGVEKFDPSDEENWVPIKRGILSSSQTFMAAPLLLSERVVILSGVERERPGIISLIRNLFQGVEGEDLRAYSLFRPDYTIYDLKEGRLIVSNSRILAEIALKETIQELNLEIDLKEIDKLVEMEPVPKDYEVRGEGEFKERVERAIAEMIREKLKERKRS